MPKQRSAIASTMVRINPYPTNNQTRGCYQTGSGSICTPSNGEPAKQSCCAFEQLNLKLNLTPYIQHSANTKGCYAMPAAATQPSTENNQTPFIQPPVFTKGSYKMPEVTTHTMAKLLKNLPIDAIVQMSDVILLSDFPSRGYTACEY